MAQMGYRLNAFPRSGLKELMLKILQHVLAVSWSQNTMRNFASAALMLSALLWIGAPVPAAASCPDGVLEAGEECDDGNLIDGDCCSSDCLLAPNESACDDGDGCTLNDECFLGVCEGSELCDDSIACTRDVCDPQTGGCTFIADDALCNDGLDCSGVEVCSGTDDCLEGEPMDCSYLDAECVLGSCVEGVGVPATCIAEPDEDPRCQGDPNEEEEETAPADTGVSIVWEDDPGDDVLTVRGSLKAGVTSRLTDVIATVAYVHATGLDQRTGTRRIKRKLKLKPGGTKRVRVPLRKLPIQSTNLWTRMEIQVEWLRADETTVVLTSEPRWVRYDERYRNVEVRGASLPAEEITAADVSSPESLWARMQEIAAPLFDLSGRAADPLHRRGRITDLADLRARDGVLRWQVGGGVQMNLLSGTGGVSDTIFQGYPQYLPDLFPTLFPVCAFWPAEYVDSGFGEDGLPSSGFQWGRAARAGIRVVKAFEAGEGIFQALYPQVAYQGFLDDQGCVSLNLDEGGYVATVYPLWDVDGVLMQARPQLAPPYLGPDGNQVPNPEFGRIEPANGYTVVFTVGPQGSPLPPFANLYLPGPDPLSRVSAVISYLAGTPDSGFDLHAQDSEGVVRRLSSPRDVAVSSDGAYVYVAGGVSTGSLLSFRRDAGTGALTFDQYALQNYAGFTEGIDDVRAIASGTNAKSVFLAGDDDTLAVISHRALPQGRLGFDEVHKDGEAGVDGINSATGVAVSPDGENVYVASDGDTAVAVFSRNSFSGWSYLEHHVNGQGGVTGLNSPNDVAVSADGQNVYVVSTHRVAVFSRNATTGALTFMEHKKDGQGVKGIGIGASVVVSSDGNEVYALGSKTIAAFHRNANGTLNFFEQYKNEKKGISGLNSGTDLAMSVDGANLYVSSGLGDAVLVFGRDVSNGNLTFLERHDDGVGGVDGLNAVEALAVSPDGSNVYAVGYNDHAIASFDRDPLTGLLVFAGVQRSGPISKARRTISVSADQGCPSGDSPEEGWYTAKYGGCYSLSKSGVFLGQSPFSADAMHHTSRWKYIIAHEVGHLMANLLVERSMAGNYYASDSLSGLSPMCRCDHVASANSVHCFQSLEDVGSALTEGWAQFYAARAFNNLGEGNCSFAYYKEYKYGPTYTAHPPPLYFNCQTPLQLMDTYCDVAVPNDDNNDGGIEADWMYFLWLAHEHATNGSSLDDLRTILNDTLADGDFMEISELAPAATAHFGPSAQATHFAQSVTDAAID
jgi:cysteine-rich repeat protein